MSPINTFLGLSLKNLDDPLLSVEVPPPPGDYNPSVSAHIWMYPIFVALRLSIYCAVTETFFYMVLGCCAFSRANYDTGNIQQYLYKVKYVRTKIVCDIVVWS